MKEIELSCDKKGRILACFSRYKRLRIFSAGGEVTKEDIFKGKFCNQEVLLARIELKCFFPKKTFSSNSIRNPNLIIVLGLKKKKLRIIESQRKRNLTFVLDSKIESACNFRNDFFFYANNKIYFLDQLSGEFLKKINLRKSFHGNFSVSLDLSKDGRYLIIQTNSIFVLDSIKGTILKKIFRPLTKMFFLELWKGNRLFYAANDGKVQIASLSEKKFFQMASLGIPYPKVIPVEVKSLKKGRSVILIFFFRKKVYFFLFDFGKKIRIRNPFSLYINEKDISFCFLRPRKSLVIVFSKGKKFIPLKIKLKEVYSKIPIKKKSKQDPSEDGAIFRQKLKIKKKAFRNFLDFFHLIKNKNKSFLWKNNADEIFFKFGNLRKSINQKIILNPFWLIKNVTRFKSSFGISQDLKFFQKKNILKTIYKLSYEWIEPFLNFILKDNLKIEKFETNFLIWGKEIFFHHFFSLLENKIIRKVIRKVKNIDFSNEENFSELYISLALLTIQGGKLHNRKKFLNDLDFNF